MVASNPMATDPYVDRNQFQPDSPTYNVGARYSPKKDKLGKMGAVIKPNEVDPRYYNDQSRKTAGVVTNYGLKSGLVDA